MLASCYPEILIISQQLALIIKFYGTHMVVQRPMSAASDQRSASALRPASLSPHAAVHATWTHSDDGQ